MTRWNQIKNFLTRPNGGFVADGRTLGLGLATAMAKSRQDPAAGVEEYLRRHAEQEPRRVTS